MLIDALTRALRESEALSAVYSKLDAGSDAALGIASAHRLFLSSLSFFIRFLTCHAIAVVIRRRL